MFKEAGRISKHSLASLHIFLIGFMGTGKSVVGEALALRLKRSPVDTDRLVERITGQEISRIFKQYGEAYFREREHEALKIILRSNPPGSLVVSTGGGIMLNPENKRLMKERGLIILLKATPRAIKRRLRKTINRPLIAGPDSGGMINKLLSERERIYQDYDYRVDTTGKNVQQVVRDIEIFLAEH